MLSRLAQSVRGVPSARALPVRALARGVPSVRALPGRMLTRTFISFEPKVKPLKFLNTVYQPTPGFQQYSRELEEKIAEVGSQLHKPEEMFTSPDGSVRQPSDTELELTANLASLALEQRLTKYDAFKLGKESSFEYSRILQNTELLQDYCDQGSRILDKVPFEDPTTGEIKWRVIREGTKEGWEFPTYFLYVPALIVMFGIMVVANGQGIGDWAMEELRLRVHEKYNDDLEALAKEKDVSPEELKKRDELMVERIINGEYDRVAGLKTAGSDLPTSLL